MFVVLRYAFLFSLIVLINACSHTPESDSTSSSAEKPASGKRYVGKDRDWGPGEEIDMSHVPDATPRYETRTIAGNKNPYTVLGKTYVLMDDERGYKARGKASWYGYKFNGEQTSNGDLYDMFSMTAAHKTLPIPSYVRVTNIDNNKSVVVRVNDRGPFHEDRIIDLSYAAAQRLGITKVGTGDVEVEALVPDDDPRPPLRAANKSWASNKNTNVNKSSNVNKTAVSATEQSIQPIQATTYSPEVTSGTSGAYLQIAAFGVEASAKQFASQVGSKLSYPVVISTVDNPQKLYRVRVGPFESAQKIEQARDQLQKINVLQSHVVY